MQQGIPPTISWAKHQKWMAPIFFFHAPRTKNRSVKAPIPNAIAKTIGGTNSKYVPFQSFELVLKDTTANMTQNTSLKAKKIEPVTIAFFWADIFCRKNQSCSDLISTRTTIESTLFSKSL